nr:MAG TPA: hypothetical protein [Caudoviricetes sp.]
MSWLKIFHHQNSVHYNLEHYYLMYPQRLILF